VRHIPLAAIERPNAARGRVSIMQAPNGSVIIVCTVRELTRKVVCIIAAEVPVAQIPYRFYRRIYGGYCRFDVCRRSIEFSSGSA
jgi:hypothetical protein